MASRGEWKHVKDGEWIHVPAKGHKNQCCDCGLVHRIEYRIAEDGTFEVRFARDNRATAAVRRKRKVAAEPGKAGGR